MSLFPEYLESLELSPSQNWQDPKSENHVQRQSMNKLVMDYLITGELNFELSVLIVRKWMFANNKAYFALFIFLK